MKLGTPMGFYPVADGDDDIKVEKLNLALDCFCPFNLNCCNFCNSSFVSQCTLIENVFNMPGNNGFIPLEELRQLIQ